VVVVVVEALALEVAVEAAAAVKLGQLQCLLLVSLLIIYCYPQLQHNFPVIIPVKLHVYGG
jgi:hypothetical protein